MAHTVVPSLQQHLNLTRKGEVRWDDKGLPKVGHNARLVVKEQPEVQEMHGAEGWLAFWHAAKETQFLPTAPMAF